MKSTSLKKIQGHKLCPIPDDYFNGLKSDRLIIPDNILFFRRTGSDQLTVVPGSHYHHRFVCIINLKTKGTINVDRRIFPFMTGDALLIFPFQYHFYPQLVFSPLDWIFLTFETPHPEQLLPLRDRTIRVSEFGKRALATLIQQARSKSFTFEKPDNSFILNSALFLHSLRQVAEKNSYKAPPLTPSHQIIHKVQSTIGTDQTLLSLSIKEIATRIHISESHLRSQFRESSGMSLGIYLRKLRLNRSCGLLINSRLSIGEIAEKCGFTSLFNFGRTFKRENRCTPSQFRSRYRS
ncbi:MAG: AraC family transcriptional regulator [Verrucomicrobiota bacterium]